jgi:hypothetical protein
LSQAQSNWLELYLLEGICKKGHLLFSTWHGCYH